MTRSQRLMGASLLVFANKIDVAGCMNDEEIRKVHSILIFLIPYLTDFKNRDSVWMLFTHTSGQSNHAVRSPERT